MPLGLLGFRDKRNSENLDIAYHSRSHREQLYFILEDVLLAREASDTRDRSHYDAIRRDIRNQLLRYAGVGVALGVVIVSVLYAIKEKWEGHLFPKTRSEIESVLGKEVTDDFFRDVDHGKE